MPRPWFRRPGIWVATAFGVWLLYYIGASIWGYVSVRQEKARLEREILHTRAKAAAYRARAEAMKDPEVLREIRRRRQGY